MDDELDSIIEPGYLDAIGEASTAELRDLRSQCQRVETQLSYLRRLIQGHLDIISGERDRRSAGGDPADVADLVERLPAILAGHLHGPATGRAPSPAEPVEVDGRLADRLDEIAEVIMESPAALTDQELAGVAGDLGALELEVSSLRRTLFGRIDAVQAEVTRRYRDGEARVEDLLAGG